MKNNIYVLDPHIIGISKTISNHIFNLPYSNLSYLKNLLIHKKLKVCLHADSSLPIFKLRIPLIGRRILTIIEYFIWLKVNKYKWISFCSIYNIPRGSIVFIDTVTISKININAYKILDNRNCKMIFYFNHFFNNLSLKTKLINEYKNCNYLVESNFKNPKISKLDKTKFLFFPYSAEERFFKAARKTKVRNPKVLVVGSVITEELDNKDALKEECGNTLINPHRVDFYKKFARYPEKIKHIASVYNPLKDIKNGKKNEYLSLDMTEYYSSYEFFVCPEDITGLPSRNMIEGLAAGCIYFGNENLDYFKHYKFIPYKHFLPYDGTIEDLIKQWEIIKKDKKLILEMRKFIKEIIYDYSVENLSRRFLKTINDLNQ